MRQDVENAVWHYEYKDGKKTRRRRETDVSFHMVNKITGPYYHVGVDTIDAFCFSKYKTLTEKELDKVFVDFCVSRDIPQDEKDSDAEQFAEREEQERLRKKADELEKRLRVSDAERLRLIEADEKRIAAQKEAERIAAEKIEAERKRIEAKKLASKNE